MWRPRGPRAWRTGLLLVAAFALGVGVAGGRLPALSRVPQPGVPPAGAAAGVPAPAGDSAPTPAAARAATPAAGVRASAEQALHDFLTAEAEGDYRASYELLSAADHGRYRTPASWVAAHAQLPPVAGFELEAARSGSGTATVPALLRLRSGLDPVLGLVPARARVEWVAVKQDGGWRVNFGDSDYAPLYPPDHDAPEAARAWAAAVRDGAPARRDDGGALFGVAALAGRLRGAAGPVEVGAAGPLPASGDASGLVAAFGPEAAGWARVVPLRAPVPVDLVLAPVEDAWTVVGVLRPTGDR